MNMSSVNEEINNISKIVVGREIVSPDNIYYEDRINELISSIGFDGFFEEASYLAKSEFLAYAKHNNFKHLCSLLNQEDSKNIIGTASVGKLRVILLKLIDSPEVGDLFLGDDVFSSLILLDNDKRILLEGFRKKTSEEIKKNNYKNIDVKRIISERDELYSDYVELKNSQSEIIEELNKKIKNLEEKNAEIIQERIDKNLSAYVEKSVAALNEIEKKLKRAAARWSTLSVFILFSGFTTGIGFALFGYLFGPELKDLKWPELLIFSIKGIFIVSAFVVAAGYSFMKSNAFTHEAIIVSNRAHAIQFGKLYLEIYGNTVERSEMQKIFENWNISSDTAFLKPKNDKSDPVKFSEFLDSLKKVKELIPSIGKE